MLLSICHYYLFVFCIVRYILLLVYFCFFKQKTAYEMRISDWSSDVCSSDLTNALAGRRHTLTGKSRFAAAAAAYEHERRDGRLPATWEVIYAHAWAPQPGAPIREGGFDVTSIPVSNIPIRRR